MDSLPSQLQAVIGTMLTFFLALIPILLILVLMLGLRWGAVKASIAGYLAALVIAVTLFWRRDRAAGICASQSPALQPGCVADHLGCFPVLPRNR